MYRSLWCKLGGTLKRTTAIINGESSSSSSLAAPAKYFPRIQNPNVVLNKSRVTNSIFNSFSTTTRNNPSSSSDSSNSFVVSYLISSCGLSETEAITASRKLNFKTKSKPDSVLKLLKGYGFTESHISKVINKVPSILQSETLKPKLDFFISKGLHETDLANVISDFPTLLARGLHKEIIPSFDGLKSIIQSDENVIEMVKRNSCIISIDLVEKVKVNVELLRKEGVPDTNICKHLIHHPRAYTADRFEEIVDKVKEMGFRPSQDSFLTAAHMLRIMSGASLRKKMDVYKRCGGWSEDQIQKAFRKNPTIVKAPEKKIMAVFNFLVKEMGYDSLIVAENPVVFCCNLEERVIPRCSVIRVLVSRGLIEESVSLNAVATMVDESFLEKFVKRFEQEVPGLTKVYEGQSSYKELLQN